MANEIVATQETALEAKQQTIDILLAIRQAERADKIQIRQERQEANNRSMEHIATVLPSALATLQSMGPTKQGFRPAQGTPAPEPPCDCEPAQDEQGVLADVVSELRVLADGMPSGEKKSLHLHVANVIQNRRMG